MSSVKKPFTASQMSMVLFIALGALICILVGGSALAATLLLKQSTDATHAQIDADISSGDTARLEALKQYLAKNANGVSKTASLTQGLGKYDQNSIVATINGYANKAGVSITSFDFNSGGPAGAAATASSGSTVNLAFGTSVPYTNFITFLRLLEQGLMPAQVTAGAISTDTDKPGNVSIAGLTVQVAQ